MSTSRRPQILLLGNGINRAFFEGAFAWNNFIKELSVYNDSLDKTGTDDKEISKVPYPLQIVLRTGDNVDAAIKNAKFNLYGEVGNDEQRDVLRKILSMNFDHILTTNYSYELEMAALDRGVKLTDNRLKKTMQKHTKAVKSAEAMYLLHTYNSVDYNGAQNNIWHIHGEARKPDSMVIGHYYYGNLLFKYKKYFDKLKNHYSSSQEKGQEIEIKSWLDAFILGDVYILGFGMDFSEMDLWWLINRKKRERADHGMTVFYEPSPEGFNLKGKLLVDYDVTVKSMGYTQGDNTDYKSFYREALSDIENQINSN